MEEKTVSSGPVFGDQLTYPSYKDSGVEWIERIPGRWRVCPLFIVAREKDKKNFGNQVQNVLSLSYGKIIDKDVSDNFGLLPESFETYQIVSKGNIILRLTDLQNDKRSLRVGLVNHQGIITSAYICLDFFREIDSSYAFYLLHAYDITKVFYSFGGGVRQTMKFEDLRWLPILIPPFEEQCAIATFLDRETAKVDLLIAKKERLIELLQEKRTALITQAVTKGLDPNVPMKDSGIEWIDDIPSSWSVCPLFVVAQEKEEINSGNQQKNVLSLSYGKIIDRDVSDNYGLLPESFETYQIVHPGNVILRLTDLQNDKRSLRVGLVTASGIITSAYVCLGLSRDIESAYAYYLLHAYDIIKVFYSYGGGVRQTMKFEDLKWLPILKPSHHEQHVISVFLDRETAKIDALITKIREARDRLREYRTALISSAVTGDIDVRDLA